MRADINLPIKGKWFDMIARGEKREEYRTLDNRQVVRFAKESMRHGLPSNAVAVFRNGYRMDSPALAVRLIGMSVRSGDMAAHPEWGEPTGKGSHFVISLGKVLSVAPYHDVRETFKEGCAE